MSTIRLTKQQARRLAVRAQLLDAASAPDDLVEVVEHLTAVQNEPTAAVAPAADLVLFSRLGAPYRPQQLLDALERRGTLYELDAMIYPSSHLRWRLPEMAAWPPPRWAAVRQWLDDNDEFRRDVLALLAEQGPLPTSAIPDTSTVPWRSSGWTSGKNVSQLLGFLSRRGEIAMVGRDGNERIWDVAERAYPLTRSDVPLAEAHRRLNELRLAALGVVRPGAAGTQQELVDFAEVGTPVEVEGTRRTWRADPALLERIDEPFAGRTVLLSPFDRLVFDRKRMAELFDFDYALEMYKPAAQRRWGYYALPILVGDRLVGKLDAAADFDDGAFRVNAVHEDVELTDAEHRSIHDAVDDLAAWLGLRATGRF